MTQDATQTAELNDNQRSFDAISIALCRSGSLSVVFRSIHTRGPVYAPLISEASPLFGC